MKKCHKCSALWDGLTQPGARETCLICSADLHVCLNCRFFDEHKPYQCFVDIADPVIYKDRANHCEEFQFADKNSQKRSDDSSDKAREQWDKLFKKKDTPGK